MRMKVAAIAKWGNGRMTDVVEGYDTMMRRKRVIKRRWRAVAIGPMAGGVALAGMEASVRMAAEGEAFRMFPGSRLPK